MTTIRSIQWVAALTATAIMVVAQPLYAAIGQVTPRRAATISDVGLSAGGLLEGKLVDSQGRPITQGSVAILHDGLEIARTTTNEEGTFQVGGLRGGVHQIVGETGTANCRFWQEGKSPPAAQRTALVVSSSPLVRGQQSAIACVPQCPTNCRPACQPACQTAYQPACQTAYQPACQTVNQPACQTAYQPACQTVNQPACQTAYQPTAAKQTNSWIRPVQYQKRPAATAAQSAASSQQVQYSAPQQVLPQQVPAAPAPAPYVETAPPQGFETWGCQPRIRDLLIATAIAAAIAIPIAIANSGTGS